MTLSCVCDGAEQKSPMGVWRMASSSAEGPQLKLHGCTHLRQLLRDVLLMLKGLLLAGAVVYLLAPSGEAGRAIHA